MKTSHGWFDVAAIGPGVWAIAEPGHEEEVHSYLIEGERDLAVLDTGMGVGDFRGLVSELSERRPIVLQSHAHWDHIGASAAFDRVLVHESEVEDLHRDFSNESLFAWFKAESLRGIPFPDGFDLSTAMIRGTVASGLLQDGQRIDLGGRVLDVHHTPGHSPGGITIFDPATGLLFPGDAVNRGPLYLFSDQADLAAYRQTLEKLAGLVRQSQAVYPSHYQAPMTPGEVIAIRDAFEEILGGRQPDLVQEDREVYDYEHFVFWIRPGAIAELT